MGAPKFPTPPDTGMPPPSAHPATLASASASAAMRAQKAAAKDVSATANGTIATSPEGLPKPNTGQKTLLGQ